MRGVVRILLALAFVVMTVGAQFEPAVAEAPANEHFQQTWARTDKPVAGGQVSRTWMWGPEAFTGAVQEAYAEAPGAIRSVQYFDKARMEITDPAADPSSIWYVTNGLLVVELVTGRLQVGNNTFEERSPAQVNVAGDADDPTGPTYATFGAVLDAQPLVVGSVITQRIDRAGMVSDDPALAGRNITVGFVDDVTNHAIAEPFWTFMNLTGTVWANGAFTTAPLFQNAYFATGRPIIEAYWANVKVAGSYQDVLLQCFERRCLTYTPENDPGWQVEAGNVGQHYHTWRYGQGGTPPPDGATGYAFVRMWGSEGNGEGQFSFPWGIATDSQGNVYVSDQTGRIQKFDSDGNFLLEWGNVGSGDGEFQDPRGVAVDSQDNVYVVDAVNGRVQKFDAEGNFLMLWGSHGEGPGQLMRPSGIAIDSQDNVYVADSNNNRVQKFTSDGTFLLEWSHDDLIGPRDIAADNAGNVYVAVGSRVEKYDSNGNYLTQWGRFGTDPGRFVRAYGIAVDGQGNVYVSDQTSRIQVFDANGAHLLEWGSRGSGPGEFENPHHIAIDDAGNVYVVDNNNHRVQKFEPVR